MRRKDRIILQKIIGYIRDAASFTADMQYDEFMRDKKTISATAFAVGQIGELVRELSEDIQQRNTDIPWRSIRGMRNRIVHDYENVELTVLWGTITKSLPELLQSLETLLEQEAGDS